MKTMKYILMAFTALVLISCGGGDEPEPNPTPTPTGKGKFLTQSCNMPAEATETVVSLNGLTAAVDKFNTPESWLTVIRQVYISGTPTVELSARENTLVLTVRQAAYNASSGADMGSTHDTPTNQPAYIPARD